MKNKVAVSAVVLNYIPSMTSCLIFQGRKTVILEDNDES